MGSLILAGAIKGAGEGMLANVERENVNKQRDLDREHDEALQRMRDEAAMSRQTQDQTSRQDFGREMYGVQREDQLEDATAAATAASMLERGRQQFEGGQNALDRESEFMIQAMKMYQTETNKGALTSKDGKWDMQVLTDTVMGENGIPMEQDRFVVREPNSPLVLEQFENVMLPNGQTEEERTRALAISKSGKLNKAEKDLLSKAGTDADDSSEYLEAFGYLPVSYYRKIAQNADRGANGFSTFLEKFRSPTKGAERTATQALKPAITPEPAPLPPAPAAAAPTSTSTFGQAEQLSAGYDPTQRSVRLQRSGASGGL